MFDKWHTLKQIVNKKSNYAPQQIRNQKTFYSSAPFSHIPVNATVNAHKEKVAGDHEKQGYGDSGDFLTHEVLDKRVGNADPTPLSNIRGNLIPMQENDQ